MKQTSITITKNADYGAIIPLTRSLLALFLAGIIMHFPAAAEEVSAGFLFDRFKLSLEAGERTEAAGAFFSSQQTDSDNVWACPPFFSRDRQPAVESHE